MIKHIVCFSFKPEVSPAQVEGCLQALNALPAQIPFIRNWSVGKNVSPRDRTYEYALHGDFADLAELERYLAHPAHEQVVREWLVPLWASRAIVDYEY